jgi:hypothetical protein
VCRHILNKFIKPCDELDVLTAKFNVCAYYGWRLVIYLLRMFASAFQFTCTFGFF